MWGMPIASKPHLYLSAGMRGHPRFNQDWFERAARVLRDDGYTITSPWEHDLDVNPGIVDEPGFLEGVISPTLDYKLLLAWDLHFISGPDCDGIVLGPGWTTSQGCAMERQVAETCGKKVYYWAFNDTIYEKNPPQVIGLMGYAQVGKDTTATILAHHQFVRVSFADKLRELLLAVDPWIGFGRRLSTIVKHQGWEYAKAKTEAREYLQKLGTGARAVLGAGVWVDAAMSSVQPDGRYVFSDVRFPNEAEAVQAAGGTLWRVERPGYGPVNDHVSERALDDWTPDIHVINDGTLEDLEKQVDSLITSWWLKP